ncbi:hypothetical protein KKF55_03045 [Patescibacteria group bacterium]|nr:hypothetical protein [Patescibacteria group bacterium]
MEGESKAAIDAWRQRDAQIQGRFDESGFLIRAPKLNRYRDHLLAGIAVGALPMEGRNVYHEDLEELATLDHDAIAAPGSVIGIGLQSAFVRRGMTKLLMDVQAGNL